MVALGYFIAPLLASFAVAVPTPDAQGKPSCLTDDQSNKIISNWLRVWSAGGLSSLADLSRIVTKDINHLDGTFGPTKVGIDALYKETQYQDPYVKNNKQTHVTSFHVCDRIALRWKYSAVTTGYQG